MTTRGGFNSTEFKSSTVQNLTQSMSLTVESLKELWAKEFLPIIRKASTVHNYNTRYATNQNLCRPFSRTNYGLARFSVVASQTWEATPTKIKCLLSNSFKKEYKLFLLDSQAP